MGEGAQTGVEERETEDTIICTEKAAWATKEKHKMHKTILEDPRNVIGRAGGIFGLCGLSS